jgi:hypothetical protein
LWPTYRLMSIDLPSRQNVRSAWDRRVGQGTNLGRRRTDHLEHRRTAQALGRLVVAVKIGVLIAGVAAVGATFFAWRAKLLSTPIAVLVALAVVITWAVAHRLASRSRAPDPFPHVDKKIWLP